MASGLPARVAEHAAHLGGCALSACGGLACTPGGGRTPSAAGGITRGRGPSHPLPRDSPGGHDGTERPLPRPHNTTAQNAYESGKHKRPMLKHLRLINTAWRRRFLSDTPPGRIHDQRLADTTPYPLPAGSQRLQELGFPACILDGVDSLQPTRKPRGHALTRAQNAGNRKVSRRRVRIEPVNRRVKRCRLRKETIRVRTAGIRDMVMDIGCALHNVRVRLTPSWTPMS
jgi:hypothetical protein